MTTGQGDPRLTDEPTIGKLVADTTKEFSQLLRSEIELAKTELRFSVRAGGISIGLFAGAAILVLLAIVMASFALALFLDWWFAGTATAFAIVMGLYLVIAALLGFIGSRKIRQVKPPEQTIEAVRNTAQVFKR
jgi:hypothetical protein